MSFIIILKAIWTDLERKSKIITNNPVVYENIHNSNNARNCTHFTFSNNMN